jgi:zona occludens toxin
MLIFNDGPPRAGKSYDTVKNHILPAIKAGRRVYARLDGLNHSAIAAYLTMDESRVRELLHHVSPANVVGRFVCHWQPDPDFVSTPEQPEDPGRYVIPDELRDALVVVDEVHEFYPAGMKPLDKPQEQFFARHGQFGMDMVLASQTFDRMHSEIRARVERRVLFRKLSHFKALEWVGLGGKSRYSQRFSINNGSGKFKEIGSESHRYDAAIFPLYAGYQPGTKNTEVYEGGVKEAGGAGLKFYLPLAGIAALVGLFVVFNFFDAEDGAFAQDLKGATATPSARTTSGHAAPVGTPTATPAAVGPLVPKAKEYEHPGVAYIMALVKENRPRTVGKFVKGDGTEGGFVDFVSGQGHVAERLTIDQLKTLGWRVNPTNYGYVLLAEGEAIIATEWPIDRWGTVSGMAQQAVGGGAGTRGSAGTSVADPPSSAAPLNASAGSVIGGTQVTGYGDLGIALKPGA